MGPSIGDFDLDGDLDLFVTDIEGQSGNRLYRYDGNRIFTDVAIELGVDDGGWGWGCAFIDYDNDGDPDITMTNGLFGFVYGPDFRLAVNSHIQGFGLAASGCIVCLCNRLLRIATAAYLY